MANPIKTSDLYVHSDEIKVLLGELDQLIEKRKQLQAQVDEQVQAATALRNATKKLTVTTSAQRDEIEEHAKQADEIAKRYKNFTSSLNDNAVKISALKNAQQQLNRINKLEAKLLSEKEGSYNRLSAQYSLNKLRLNQMSAAERKATKEGQALEKQTREIFEEMKRLQEATGKHTLNVGNYASALEGLQGPIGNTVGGFKNMGKQLKVLLRNPVVLFLAAIVGALSALFKAFKRSEKGAEFMTKATGALNGVMSKLTEIASSVAESLTAAFRDPIGAIKEFGNSIGRGLKSFFTDPIGSIKNLGNAIGELVEEVEEEVNSFIKLEEAKKNAIKVNRDLARSAEQLATVEQVQAAIADDTTKSFAEREAAAEKSRKAAEARAAKEIQIARNNLSVINQEISLRKANGEAVSDLLDRQLEGYRALASAERELALTVVDNEKTRNELRQDRLERDLDILIDGFDNQKTINERRLRDDKLAFDERTRLLDETRRLADESFAKQIQTIQEFTNVSVNANELIAESDAVALNEKIRGLGLSEIIEGRLLEIVRERRVVTQDLAEAEVDLANRMTKAKEAEAKAAAEALQLQKEQALEQFDQQQAFDKSEFDLLKSTEQQKTEFRLTAEKERFQKILELNEQFGSDMSALQLDTIKNQIALIDAELQSSGNQIGDIYDIFGFDIDDPTKSAISQSIGFVKAQLSELTAARVQAANQAVQASANEVSQAQRALDAEIQNRNAGFAHNVATARKELEAAKKNQERALKEQQKAQRAQNRIQTLQQAQNLVTASAKIWSSFAGLGPAGPFLAVGAIAAMWGSFVAAKIRAAQLTKKEFGDGGLEIIGGGTHASGNDTYLGFQSEGRPAYGERGEAHAIIPATQTRKYRDILPTIVDSLRKGTFESTFQRINGQASSDSAMIMMGQAGGATDVSAIEGDVAAMRKGSERKFHRDGQGNLVERYKNLTRVYV